jgi:hypothetical protein
MKKFLIIWMIIIFGGLFLFAQMNQDDYELKFSHKLHVVENETECTTCHGAAETSQTGADNLLPDMETCGSCHDVEDDENCGMCHSNVEEPAAVPRVKDYNTKFSHEKHLGAKLECSSCHSGIENRTAAGIPTDLPKMNDCMNCHSSKSVSNDCQTCHNADENLMPASHTPNFVHTHSDLAKSGAKEMSMDMNCSTCHSDNFCQECHEGENLDNTTHPMNFAFTHALQAEGKEKECSSCHTDRQFCNSCHREYQVLPHNHTPGWAIANVGGRHAEEARIDLESCMSCHEQDAEQVCQPCHQQ